MRYLLAFLLLSTGFILPEAYGVQQQQTYHVTLYYSLRCPYSKKVLAYLKQAGITIPMKNVNADPEAKEELQKLGGYMIVPCLIVNGNPIYDSSKIIDWLSENQEYLSKS
jgi:glutaredoxin